MGTVILGFSSFWALVSDLGLFFKEISNLWLLSLGLE